MPRNNEAKVSVLIKARDLASKTIRGFGANLKTLASRTISGALRWVRRLSFALSVTLVGAFGLATRAAAKFQSTMAEVATLIGGDSTAAVASMSAAVLDMTKRLPKTADDLGAGLYQVLSAGVEGAANQMKVLEVSAKAAVGGLTDTFSSVDAITTVLNAYQQSADKATQISDIMFETVKQGKVTFGEIAQNIGTVAQSASLAGISFEEVAAAVATMTKGGTKVEETFTSLNRILLSIITPTAEAQAAARALGIEWSSTGLRTRGLGGLMGDLEAATRGNIDALTSIVPDIRSFRAAAVLAGTGAAEYAKQVKNMTSSQGAAQSAFDKINATFNSQFQLLKNRLNKALIETGTIILPELTEAFKILQVKADGFSEWLKRNDALIKEFSKNVSNVIVFLGEMGGALLKATFWLADLADQWVRIFDPAANFAQPNIAALDALGDNTEELTKRTEGYRTEVKKLEGKLADLQQGKAGKFFAFFDPRTGGKFDKRKQEIEDITAEIEGLNRAIAHGAGRIAELTEGTPVVLDVETGPIVAPNVEQVARDAGPIELEIKLKDEGAFLRDAALAGTAAALAIGDAMRFGLEDVLFLRPRLDERRLKELRADLNQLGVTLDLNNLEEVRREVAAIAPEFDLSRLDANLFLKPLMDESELDRVRAELANLGITLDLNNLEEARQRVAEIQPDFDLERLDADLFLKPLMDRRELDRVEAELEELGITLDLDNLAEVKRQVAEVKPEFDLSRLDANLFLSPLVDESELDRVEAELEELGITLDLENLAEVKRQVAEVKPEFDLSRLDANLFLSPLVDESDLARVRAELEELGITLDLENLAEVKRQVAEVKPEFDLDRLELLETTVVRVDADVLSRVLEDLQKLGVTIDLTNIDRVRSELSRIAPDFDLSRLEALEPLIRAKVDSGEVQALVAFLEEQGITLNLHDLDQLRATVEALTDPELREFDLDVLDDIEAVLIPTISPKALEEVLQVISRESLTIDLANLDELKTKLQDIAPTLDLTPLEDLAAIVRLQPELETDIDAALAAQLQLPKTQRAVRDGLARLADIQAQISLTEDQEEQVALGRAFIRVQDDLKAKLITQRNVLRSLNVPAEALRAQYAELVKIASQAGLEIPVELDRDSVLAFVREAEIATQLQTVGFEFDMPRIRDQLLEIADLERAAVLAGDPKAQAEAQRALTAAREDGRAALVATAQAVAGLGLPLEDTRAIMEELGVAMEVIGAPAVTFSDQLRANLVGMAAGAGDLANVLANSITKAFRGFGTAVSGAFKALTDGSKAAGAAFRDAMLGALGAVAQGFGEFFLAKAIAAFAVLDFARGAGLTAAATAMFALAGVLGGLGGGGSSGGGSGGGGSFSTESSQEDLRGAADRGAATIIIKGGILNMNDPNQARQLENALSDLDGRRVIIRRGRG